MENQNRQEEGEPYICHEQCSVRVVLVRWCSEGHRRRLANHKSTSCQGNHSICSGIMGRVSLWCTYAIPWPWNWSCLGSTYPARRRVSLPPPQFLSLCKYWCGAFLPRTRHHSR